MGGLLFGLLRFSVKTATQLVGVALARTLVPRFPPQNYKPQEAHQQSTQTSESAPIDKVSSKLAEPIEIAARVAEPKTPTRPCRSLSCLQPSIEVFDYAVPVTPRRLKTPELGENHLSLYTPVSPSKEMYISPVRSLYSKRPVDVDMERLRAASDRINAMLEQSRRRVDSGEDRDATRREARRKRTQELGLLPSLM